MLRISRVEEQLASLAKPALERIEQLHLAQDDCLVICSGFEDRALGFLRSATLTQTGSFRTVVINYLPFIKENRESQIQEICRSARLDTDTLIYDRQNPLGFGDRFSEVISSVRGRLYVDISGMSRLLIAQILVALSSTPSGFLRRSVLYAEALEYPPEKTEVEQAIENSRVDPLSSIMLLSSGVFDVTILPELSSLSLDGQQTRLVIFPSFNTDQLTALRTELQPSRYSIIHGIPPAHENGWRTEAIAKLNHIESLQGEESHSTSTLDYRETLDCLLEIYRKHGSIERILVAPTGSKMQTVATGLFRSFIRDVQIVYPTPGLFPSPANYTVGTKQLFRLMLDDYVL